jgi:hypothetical protein
MSSPGRQPHVRRTLLQRWLVVCVIAIVGQTGAPALAWCLHDAEHGAQLEFALTDCADHIQPEPATETHPCQDAADGHDHLMLDAETPGTTASPSPALLDAAALLQTGLRLTMDEWLNPAAGSASLEAQQPPAAPDPADIERLVGHTTHLLI